MLSDFLKDYEEYLAPVEPVQVEQLEAHLSLLEKWNKTVNLTRVTGEDAIRKHVGESLFLAARLERGPVRIVDLGSGGGFPGIPVAIARPDAIVTLVESDVRKGVFLREATRDLANVTVVSDRFENLAGRFDWLVSRAVNLAGVVGGPLFRRAAFLGLIERGRVGSVAGAFDWKTIALPWDPNSFLSLGVSRETLPVVE